MASIRVQDLDVRQTAGNELPRLLDFLRTAFHADDLAARSDARGEKTERASRATADLDRPPTRTDPNLIEEPLRVRRELFRLSLQALALCLPIAEKIGVRLAQISLRKRFAAGRTSFMAERIRRAFLRIQADLRTRAQRRLGTGRVRPARRHRRRQLAPPR